MLKPRRIDSRIVARRISNKYISYLACQAFLQTSTVSIPDRLRHFHGSLLSGPYSHTFLLIKHEHVRRDGRFIGTMSLIFYFIPMIP